MGRGQIVSGGEYGMYQVKLIYAYRNRINARLDGYTQQIALLDQRITAIDAQIAAEADPVKKAKLQDTRSVMVLQRASVQKLHDYYSTKMPADPTVAAWCADATEDLAAGTSVGTIEIPGEPSTVLVRPAYDNRSVYTAARDGNLMPSVAGSPHQVLFNWMLLPGWQRHKPIYRAGTIVPDSLDFDNNTCSVCLDPAYSSQQSLPAVDGLTVGDCNMGDDDQSEYLTSSAEDFCSRNPGHPFCTQSPGSEINITDAQLAQLRNINLLVNGAYGRANDPSGIGVGDRWDVMSPGGSGDCEDFALTKMQMLVDTYGWNPNSLNMITAFSKNGEYHAMLGVRTRNRGLVVLDVNYDEVMESGRVPYRIDKVALASDDWRNYARRMDNVPIEYMTCNAGAFADGDRVVVQFTSQTWTSGKVIGFLENPQQCGFDMVFIIGNSSLFSYSWSVKEYGIAWDAWNEYYNMPGNHYFSYDQISRDACYVTSTPSALFAFGGRDWSWESDPPEPGYWVKDMSIYERSDKMTYTSRAWSSVQDVPGMRAYGQGCVSGGKHYVIGGSDWYHNYPTRSTGAPLYTANGETYFTTNFEYDHITDSWATRQAADVGRLWDRTFAISGTVFRLYGCKNLGEMFEDWMPGVRGYNQQADVWSAYTDMIRGKVMHSCGNISGKGYTGPGHVNVGGQAVDDTPTYSGLDLIAYRTEWYERFDKATNAWSFWIQDTLTPTYNYGESGLLACSQSSPSAYAYDVYWVNIDVTNETIIAKTSRAMSGNIWWQIHSATW